MIFRALLKPIRPFPLISLLAMYTLGGGLVQYVERMRSWPNFIQGAVFMLLCFLGFKELELLGDLLDGKQWPEGMTVQTARQTRLIAAITSATLVTVAVTLFINWMIIEVVWQGLALLILGFVVFCVLYYLSRRSAALTPYRILMEALIVVVSPPAVAFFLQTQDHHSFLTMIVSALVPFYLSYRILQPLKQFGKDRVSEQVTIVTFQGWERAMVLHNALILMGFMFLAGIAILNFPWFILWPVFLTFPIGLLEIWLMERVRRGGKPFWKIMSFASASVFMIPIYFLGFAFWIR